MKHTFTSLLGAAVCCLLGSLAHAQTYQQVWADEFTTGIGPGWQFENGGGGWGNNEKQYYQRANATVANGILQITARKQSVGGYAYTSSRMKTQGIKEFKYGRVEARMKLPLGQGLWPAFWMLGSNIGQVGWPACGEIDVMEHINAENKVYGTAHWDSNGHAEYGGNLITTPEAYHVYSVEWEPTYIRWFIDGVKYHEINIANNAGGTEEFQRPFFLLLNLAVAGNWPGQTVDESKLPATLFVDYVRVYQKAAAPVVRFLEAEGYSTMNGVQVEACAEGGQNVGYVDQGDWLAYNNIHFPVSGTYKLEYRVASPTGGTLSSDLNGGAVQLGNILIPATGGWQNWTTVTRSVYVNAGTYSFGVFAQTSGWNLNWIRITPPASARPATVMATATAQNEDALTVYPNPYVAGGLLTIQLAREQLASPSQVAILDANGKQVWQTTTFGTEVRITDLMLPNGLYLIRVTNSATTITRKLRVQ
ncbi:family 16 glycosylhydrolase [Hymenobacter sp. NST-14]|uniref:carbohydrate-binding protein n=1 Tax=Hymenobacter piscis TaxID=2839984 RepID=UPI001C02AB7A|nr:family 16 glycosylhydrolase [Hymenobacter piscis]MBT9395201.1 family 16 glycosylhydrolase [Hymenobacter piscis]